MNSSSELTFHFLVDLLACVSLLKLFSNHHITRVAGN